MSEPEKNRKYPNKDPLAPPKGLKWCTNCGQQKPLDQFHKDAARVDGHRDHCTDCRRELRREESIKGTVLEDMEDQAMETLGQLSGRGGSVVPHATEALESVLRPFGGMEGYGKWLFATFLAARPGSAVRERLLTKILDLIQYVSAAGDSEQPINEMEDGDLIRIMSTHIIEFQKKANLPATAFPTLDGRVADANAYMVKRDG